MEEAKQEEKRQKKAKRQKKLILKRLKPVLTNNNNMFKKLLLFLSYISLSSQMFMTPHSLLPFQNKTNSSTTQYYPISRPHEIMQKQKNCDDALTIFKIWASLFVFTFPIISVPYHNKD